MIRENLSTTVSSVSSVVVSFVIMAAVFATAASAQDRPAVGPERPFQLAPRLERTLPNGLRVIVTRQTAIPKVSITLTVLSGYSSDPADLTGLASLTADLIQEGTKTKTSREIRRDVFGMGGSLTAAASQDYTSVSARGLSEFAPRLIDLVADVAMNPTLPEDELAILKQQHLQTVAQQQASPQFLANREFRRALFGSHPYARTSETEASLKRMDRAKLVAFHRDHYRPNNASLIVVGDQDEPCLEPGLFMKRRIPHAGLLMLPMSGHTTNIEEPGAFNLHVGEFLAAVENGRWGTWKA